MNGIPAWFTLGWLLALLVLLAVFVLAIIGRMDYLSAALFAGLALSRLFP